MAKAMTGAWRPMQEADLAAANALGDLVHPDHPEGPEIFERIFALYPKGCYVFEAGGEIAGYLISHPWHETPPELNTVIDRLPDPPAAYFIHDIALHPKAKGRGTAFPRRFALETVRNFGTVGCVTVSARMRGTCEKAGFRIVESPCPGYGEDSAFLVLKQDRQIGQVM